MPSSCNCASTPPVAYPEASTSMRVFGWIVHAQYWILNKAPFQLVKGLLFILCPLPVYIASEMIQGFANATEVLDRSVVEICKSSELLDQDIRHIEGSRPLLNTLYFYRIHLNMVVGHQDTEILNFRDFNRISLACRTDCALPISSELCG